MGDFMNIKKWQKFSIVFCWILGTLLHFTYEWSNQNNIVGLFSAVNESIWEHLKLAFFPMLIISIVGSFFIKNNVKNYWFSQLLGITSSIIFLIVFFYTYTGIIGTNFAIIDILSFYLSIILGEYIIYRFMMLKNEYNYEKMSIIILILFVIGFFIYTFTPPHIQLFKDPITGKYGIIENHN